MEVNGTIFLQIFIFLSLLLLLSRSLFAPILRLFDERERRIVGAKEEALALNRLADEKSSTFNAAYQKATESAKSALSELKSNMEREHSEAQAKAKLIAKEKLEQAELELVEQEKAIRQQLDVASAAIAEDIVRVFARKPA